VGKSRRELAYENAKLRKLVALLSEPPMTAEEAEVAIAEVKAAPPMAPEELEQAVTRIMELAAEPRCPTCGAFKHDWISNA
jgi:hypothetical protein